MALQVTRVEQAMGNGLRRLYRLPKLTTAPSNWRGPEPLRGRAGTGRRAGQARPVRPVRSLSSNATLWAPWLRLPDGVEPPRRRRD